MTSLTSAPFILLLRLRLRTALAHIGAYSGRMIHSNKKILLPRRLEQRALLVKVGNDHPGWLK
jgi:hypothetical protein